MGSDRVILSLIKSLAPVSACLWPGSMMWPGIQQKGPFLSL